MALMLRVTGRKNKIALRFSERKRQTLRATLFVTFAVFYVVLLFAMLAWLMERLDTHTDG